MKVTEFGGWALGFGIFTLFISMIVFSMDVSDKPALICMWFSIGLIAGSLSGSMGQKRVKRTVKYKTKRKDTNHE